MTPQPPFRKWEIAALAGLVLVVVALAWPGLRAPLLLDDEGEIALVRQFAGWGSIWQPDCFGLFRPVKNALFYGLLPVLDGDPIVFHAVGLLCFLAGMTGVYFLARRIATGGWTALGAAAIWALAPTQVSTAIWLSCANIGLSVAFLCLALVMYDMARDADGGTGRPSIPWLLGAVAMAFLAQISYETAVAVAPMALALDWFRGRKLVARNTVFGIGALAAVTIVYLMLRGQYGSRGSGAVGNIGFEPGLEEWKLVASAPWFLWQHLLMWLAPIGRIEFLSTYLWLRSASAPALVWAWVGWLALLAAPFLLRKKSPGAALGLAWFLIAAFPAGNFVPIYAGPIADYYLALPSIGLALAIAIAVASAIQSLRATDGPPALVCVLVILVLALPRLVAAAFFPAWAAVWREPAALYARIMESRPLQFRARAVLAREMMETGHLAEARPLARQAADEAPWHPVPLMVLAECDLLDGNFGEAHDSFVRLLAMESGEKEIEDFARLRLGMFLGMAADTRAAAMDHHRAILQNPHSDYHSRAAYELAKLYQADGDKAKAESTLRRAAAMHPDHRELADAVDALEAGRALPPPDSFLGSKRLPSDDKP